MKLKCNNSLITKKKERIPSMSSVTVFFGIFIALSERQMMEPINSFITSRVGSEAERPLPKAVSAEQGFKTLLMNQKRGIEEKATNPNGNSIEALTCSMMMEVLKAFLEQNNISVSNPSDFNLDSKTVPGQGAESSLIPSSSSQVPPAPDSSSGTLASLIPSMMEVLKAFLEQNNISVSNPSDFNLDSKTVPGQDAGSSLITSSSSQVPLTPDSPNGTLASSISLMMGVLKTFLEQNSVPPSNPANFSLDAKAIPEQDAGSSLIPSSSSQVAFSPDSPNGTPSPFSPNQTDHPIQNISPYSNLKVETAIPTLPFQENQGDGNPSFNPAGLERESFHSSLGVESKETGKILFDESGLVLRSIKEDHQNSDSFTPLNDQKGNLESNPVMTEEVQKGHETILPKTEPLQIYQQIGKNVIWSLQNNEEKIKLTLDPPELGNIYMEINREKGNIRATLWADNLATKEILEAHHGQLYTILKDDGFKLEKFDVFMQQDMSSFQDREGRVLHHGPWARDEFKEDTISTPLEASEISPALMSQSYQGSKHVDLFV
jgi:hypothetical protein